MFKRLLTVLLVAIVACAHSYIPGTKIRDTPDNHQIYEILTKIRDTFETRDAAGLLAMVSTTYFEDNGTPNPTDDYGYAELQERILKDCMDTAKEVYVSFEIHEIVIHGDYAYADLRYTSRTRLEFPAGRLWDSHRDFNRIEFKREQNNTWRIISGL